MKTNRSIMALITIFGILIVSGCSLLSITDCDSSLGDCNVPGNEGTPHVSEVSADTPSLPEGYTLNSYTIEKIMDASCNRNSDCETPMDYLVQSRCPFTSICLADKCTVVCPDVKTMEIQGEIIDVKPEMDGSILTVMSGEDAYEVLVSIPNMGEEYASSIKKIEVGQYIQVIGSTLLLEDSERIIASRIYVEGEFQGEHPCNLEPDPGRCEAAMPRYYFDKEEQKCKEFLWGGCDGTVPFDNLGVCISTCELGVPDKPG